MHVLKCKLLLFTGPSLEFIADGGKYLGEGLEPGIVVGIAIAGAIIIIALILLAIYLAIRARKQTMKEAAESYRPESSVYTSGRVEIEPSVNSSHTH